MRARLRRITRPRPTLTRWAIARPWRVWLADNLLRGISPEALAQAQAYCHAALAQAYAVAPGQLMPRRLTTL